LASPKHLTLSDAAEADGGDMHIEGLPSPISSSHYDPFSTSLYNTNTHIKPQVPILPSLPMNSAPADEEVEDEAEFEEEYK